MHILVSNDDGVFAPGIGVLANACRELGTVTVVAPDREQSGTSHSLTLHRPLRANRTHDGAYQIDGTPTDCVLLAIDALMPERPKFVFSGVNHGPNMGEDVLYSGTVSAAMEAVALGVPGVAFSFAGREPDLIAGYHAILVRLIRQIVAIEEFPPETLLNINLPNTPAEDVRGVRVTTLGSRYFSSSITRMNDPWGKPVYWIGGGEVTWSGDAETDYSAVKDSYISVTPLHMDLTNYRLMEAVAAWSLSL